MGSILKEYKEYQLEIEEKYGNNSIVFLMVGSFYEIYGVNNLGSIKALLTFFGVLASASSPFLYGIIIDQTNSIDMLIYLSLILIALFSSLALFANKFK